MSSHQKWDWDGVFRRFKKIRRQSKNLKVRKMQTRGMNMVIVKIAKKWGGEKTSSGQDKGCCRELRLRWRTVGRFRKNTANKKFWGDLKPNSQESYSCMALQWQNHFSSCAPLWRTWWNISSQMAVTGVWIEIIKLPTWSTLCSVNQLVVHRTCKLGLRAHLAHMSRS